MPIDLRLYADDEDLDDLVVSRSGRSSQPPGTLDKGKARAQPSEVWDDDFVFQTPPSAPPPARPSSKTPTRPASKSASPLKRATSMSHVKPSSSALSPDRRPSLPPPGQNGDSSADLDLSAFDDVEKTPQRRRNKSVPSPEKSASPRTPTRVSPKVASPRSPSPSFALPNFTSLLRKKPQRVKHQSTDLALDRDVLKVKDGEQSGAKGAEEANVRPPLSAPPSSRNHRGKDRAEPPLPQLPTAFAASQPDPPRAKGSPPAQPALPPPSKSQRRPDTVRTSRPPVSSSSRSHQRLGGIRPSHHHSRSPSAAELPSSGSRPPPSTDDRHRSKSESMLSSQKERSASEHENWDDDFPIDDALPASKASTTSGANMAALDNLPRLPVSNATARGGQAPSPPSRPNARPAIFRSSTDESAAAISPPTSKASTQQTASSESEYRPDSALSFASITSVETETDSVDLSDARTSIQNGKGDRLPMPTSSPDRNEVVADPPLTGSLRARREALRTRPSFSLDKAANLGGEQAALADRATTPSTVAPSLGSSQRSQRSKASDDSGKRSRKKLRKKRPSTTSVPAPTGEDDAATRKRSGSSLSFRRPSFADSLATHFRSASRASGAMPFADDSGDEGTRRLSRSTSPFQIVTAADLPNSPPLAFPSPRSENEPQGLQKPDDADFATASRKREKGRRPLSLTGFLSRSSSMNGGAFSPTSSGFPGRKRSSEQADRPGRSTSTESSRVEIAQDGGAEQRRSHRRVPTPSGAEDSDASGKAFLARVRRMSRNVAASPVSSRRKQRPLSPEPVPSHVGEGARHSVDGLVASRQVPRANGPTSRSNRKVVSEKSSLTEMSTRPATLDASRSQATRPTPPRRLTPLSPGSRELTSTTPPLQRQPYLGQADESSTSSSPPPATPSSAIDSSFDLSVDDRSDIGPALFVADESGQLKIPASVINAQSRLNEDLVRVKDFARGIAELKSVRAAYRDLLRSREESLPSVGQASPANSPGSLLVPPALRRMSAVYSRLDVEYGGWWDCCDVLIELGEGSDPAQLAASHRHRALSMHPSSSGTTLDTSNSSSIFAPSPLPQRSEMSMQILRAALGVQTPSSAGEQTPRTPSRQPSRLPHASRASPPFHSVGSTASHSSGDSMASLSPQVTPTRRLPSLTRITTPVLSTKRSASRLFQKASPSPPSAAVPKIPPKLVEPSSKPSRAVKGRTGIAGIRDFLRVLKARMKADEGRGMTAALAPPDIETRRSVSDPIRSPSTPARLHQSNGLTQNRRPLRPSDGKGDDSSEEENWDDLIASPAVPATHRHSKSLSPETPRRARTHSTGSMGANVMLGATLGESGSPWPTGARLALTTESMPQLLEYLATVRDRCREGLEELKGLTI